MTDWAKILKKKLEDGTIPSRRSVQELIDDGEYGKALITSLGFNSDIWVKTEEQAREEQLKLAQAQGQIQGAQQNEVAANQMAQQVMAQAAQQDIEQTGGAGIQQAMQQMQGV